MLRWVLLWFFQRDGLYQCLVLGLAVHPKVDLAVATWTDCSNEPGVIGTAIAEPADVVRFKVGSTRDGDEPRWLATTFTDAPGAG
jgi:hypothetical protein